MEVEVTEQQLAKLQHATDITHIQMLMANYVDYMSRMDAWGAYKDLFVHDSDESSIEYYESGEYRGDAQVQAFMKAYDAYLADPSDKRGWMEHQLICTPFIKISTDDGQRALGTWSLFIPSAKLAMEFPEMDEKLTAIWQCGKYFCEFQKVDGKWKILKLRAIAYLRAPFHAGWNVQADCAPMPYLAGITPDGPSRSYLYNFDYTMGNGGIEWAPYLPENDEWK